VDDSGEHQHVVESDAFFGVLLVIIRPGLDGVPYIQDKGIILLISLVFDNVVHCLQDQDQLMVVEQVIKSEAKSIVSLLQFLVDLLLYTLGVDLL
jgi:hypothetical protein